MIDVNASIEMIKEGIEETLDDLKQKREELAVQIKLGSMEARDEWEELEEKMQEMESKWHQFQQEAELGETAQGVGTAIKLLGAELKNGYKRLKDAL